MNRLTPSSTWPVTTQLNVVLHEGVAVDEDWAAVGMMVQEGEEPGADLVAEEDRLAIVAALGQVEGASRR